MHKATNNYIQFKKVLNRLTGENIIQKKFKVDALKAIKLR